MKFNTYNSSGKMNGSYDRSIYDSVSSKLRFSNDAAKTGTRIVQQRVIEPKDNE